jgi:hypothetical protein
VDSLSGNTSEAGDRRGPREEFSFLVNRGHDPGIGLTGDRVVGWERRSLLDRSVRPRLSLKILERDLFAPLVVPITASGLQG